MFRKGRIAETFKVFKDGICLSVEHGYKIGEGMIQQTNTADVLVIDAKICIANRNGKNDWFSSLSNLINALWDVRYIATYFHDVSKCPQVCGRYNRTATGQLVCESV